MTFTKLILSSILLLIISLSNLVSQNIADLKILLKTDDELVQVDALHQLNFAYNQISLDSALLYAQEALDLSRKIKNDSLLGTSYCRLSLTFYHLRQLDSLIFYAEKGAQLAEKEKYPKMQAYCLKMKAVGYKNKGEFNDAVKCYHKSLKLYEELNDTTGIAATYSNLGSLNQKKGLYDDALFYYFKAEKYFDQLDDTDGRSLTAAQIGDLYLDMKETSKSLIYTQKAINLTDQNQLPIRYGDLMNALGIIYHLDSTQLDSAILCFSKSLACFEKIGDLQGMGIAHNNLGNTARDQKKWTTAFNHLHKAQKIAATNGWDTSIHNDTDLGLTHELFGQLDSAEYYYLKAYDLSQENLNSFDTESLLERLYLFYKKTGNTHQALRFHELFTEHVDETKGEEVQKKIALLETQYETEKKERRIEKLEFQSTIDASKNNAFRIGLLSLIIVFSLLIMGILYRRRNERKLNAFRQKMHEKERAELDKELTFKTKQLTSHALHMVQKNKVLQEIKQRINDLSKGADTQQKKTFRSLIRRINFNIQSDEDWDTFKLYFEQTNQNFYTNLAIINKDLTSTELKLCSLIKLNMNIKETASVLNIEPTSVKTARHRLRKKLHLKQGQDLTVFIRQVA